MLPWLCPITTTTAKYERANLFYNLALEFPLKRKKNSYFAPKVKIKKL